MWCQKLCWINKGHILSSVSAVVAAIRVKTWSGLLRSSLKPAYSSPIIILYQLSDSLIQYKIIQFVTNIQQDVFRSSFWGKGYKTAKDQLSGNKPRSKVKLRNLTRSGKTCIVLLVIGWFKLPEFTVNICHIHKVFNSSFRFTCLSIKNIVEMMTGYRSSMVTAECLPGRRAQRLPSILKL